MLSPVVLAVGAMPLWLVVVDEAAAEHDVTLVRRLECVVGRKPVKNADDVLRTTFRTFEVHVQGSSKVAHLGFFLKLSSPHACFLSCLLPRPPAC
jgi:hypothetical protein